MLTLTHAQVKDALDSFTKSGWRTLLFLRECLPHLRFKSTSSQYKLLANFTEHSFKKGEVILKRSDKIPESPSVMLICKGEVRLEMENNPATKIQQELEFGVNAHRVEKLHNTASGFGNISRTLHRSQVTTIEAQQWLGEEVAFADMPLIYDAIAHSDNVKVLKITTSALVTQIDELDVQHIQTKMWQKLKFMFLRTKDLAKIKEKLCQAYPGTSCLPESVKHMDRIAPNCNDHIKKATHQQFVREIGLNMELFQLKNNGMLEKEYKDKHEESLAKG
jgi:CRP-like cAMP-binding protein